MSYGERLIEERRRLGYTQSRFAELVGSDPPKQSLCEHGHRQLRAAYLQRAAEVGVDVVYVLTGRRREGDWMGEGAKAMLDGYRTLPEAWKPVVAKLVADLHRRRGR